VGNVQTLSQSYISRSKDAFETMTSDPSRLAEISKYLSFILRHEPQSIGLQLDVEGWADIDDLIARANRFRPHNHHESYKSAPIRRAVSVRVARFLTRQSVQLSSCKIFYV
jgi:RNA:NAD 2'-phosphotransferase (TPT1/KptA family)